MGKHRKRRHARRHSLYTKCSRWHRSKQQQQVVTQNIHNRSNTIAIKVHYITRKKIILKPCETNQSVSNALAKYRVSPLIWNRDILLLSSSSSSCRRYLACNTGSSTVSNRWTNARRAARVGRRRWNAQRSEPVSVARLTIYYYVFTTALHVKPVFGGVDCR
ncbi:hypothetical protein QTP88_021813 [Uroleucon formosanum]